MLLSSTRTFWNLLTLGGATIWFVVWSLGWFVDGSTRTTLHAATGVSFFIVAAMVYGGRRATTRDEQQAARYFDKLGRLTATEVSTSAETLLPLSSTNPLRSVAQRFRETYTELTMRTERAEHGRAALDIKVRRQTSKLEQAESILASLPEPVLVVDHFDELLLSNPSAERLLGLKAASTDKNRVEKRMLTKLGRCEKLLDLLNDVRRRKTPGQRSSEIELTDELGQPQFYSVSAKTVAMTGEGTTAEQATARTCAVAVLRDIGNIKAIQKRNAEFVSAASHEMKTPLSGIKAYVELLLDGDADDEKTRDEFLNVIADQANRLQRLVENLLNIARIEAGVVTVNKDQRSLNELLEEGLRVLQPAAEQKQITLVSELSPMYLSVRVDRDMMLQVAINLLSNAIKYTPTGGRVALRSKLSGDQVQFEVQDNGVGLSPEDCQKVFEKFYRVKKDKDMAPGTGLGLALAKHIAEDVHAGTLTVNSVLGEGSTFTVTMPCAGQMT